MSLKHADSLKHYFQQLPAPILNKLTLALELDRLKDDKQRALPHDQLLGILRPFVARSPNPVPRVPTPMRLFCDPFEDLLYTGRNPNKQPGRIVRPSLGPVWQWLTTEIIPDTMRDVDVDLRHAILAGNRAGIDKNLTKLHKVSGLALTDALKGVEEGTAAYYDISQRLGGARAIEDARDMAVALRSARHLKEIRDAFGHDMETLDTQAVHQAKEFFHLLQGWSADGADLVLFTLMSRMKEPWAILPLARELDEENKPEWSQRSVFAKTLEVLLDDFDQLTDYISDLDLNNANLDEVVRDLTAFNKLGEALEKEVPLAPSVAWNTEVRQKQSDVSRLIEMHLERTPEAILQAIPTQQLGAFGGHSGTRPDLSHWPDESKSNRAVNEAAFLDGLKKLASKAAFGTVYNDVYDRIEETVENYAQSIVQTIRATEGEEQDKARAYFETAVELTRQIAGAEKAQLLRHRVEHGLE